jgi:hypothetical protein
MRQSFAFVAVKQNDVARCCLLFAQLQTQADPLPFVDNLPPFQGVPGSPPAELFFATPLTVASG